MKLLIKKEKENKITKKRTKKPPITKHWCHSLLEIVQDRRILFRIISDADKCSFEYDSVRGTSRDISFIHSPLAAFNSLLDKNKHH